MSETGELEMSDTKLSGVVKKFPALSHFILSMVISGGIVLIWHFGKLGFYCEIPVNLTKTAAEIWV